MIDQLLKSKYHATQTGLFTDIQLQTIYKLLNKVARNTLVLISSFQMEVIHRKTTEMGLGYAPIKERATQIGIEHVTEIFNKPTDRG